MSANDTQVGGSHYRTLVIQPWDYIASNQLGYFEGCAIKYITRWQEKGGIQDLEKSIHYLQKLIEVEKNKEKKNDASATRVIVRGPQELTENYIDKKR